MRASQALGHALATGTDLRGVAGVSSPPGPVLWLGLARCSCREKLRPMRGELQQSMRLSP